LTGHGALHSRHGAERKAQPPARGREASWPDGRCDGRLWQCRSGQARCWAVRRRV